MPTKVFDYLTTGLDVLILSQGDPTDSALHDLLVGVEGVHFVSDDADAIAAFLSGFTPAPHSANRAEPFSRRVSTLDLISLLHEVGPEVAMDFPER